LHVQRIFYAISKLAGILKIKNRFQRKKIKCRPDLRGSRPHLAGPAQIGYGSGREGAQAS
jgi:hypothetical protein